jgi:glycosyltransferase involved in cell wall biosynthesis
MLLSIIIPAYNESANIERVLRSVRHIAVEGIRTEIIVVDNGSTDDTVAIARSAGADHILVRGGTVASLRNAGAELAQGEVLVFLDADMELGEEWGLKALRVVEDLRRRPRTVTGSWAASPPEAGWLARCWFDRLRVNVTSHINSAHCLIRRDFFSELHGFSESLTTGEDFDLSRRVVEAGGMVLDNPSLRAIHHGYPTSLLAFFRREMWHGVGDYASWHAFSSSRVALVSTTVLTSAIMVLAVGVLAGQWSLSLAWCAGVLFLATVAAIRRVGGDDVTCLAIGIALFVLYFLARGCSMYLHIFRISMRGPRRSLM